jgi:hypothetical protein
LFWIFLTTARKSNSFFVTIRGRSRKTLTRTTGCLAKLGAFEWETLRPYRLYSREIQRETTGKNRENLCGFQGVRTLVSCCQP